MSDFEKINGYLFSMFEDDAKKPIIIEIVKKHLSPNRYHSEKIAFILNYVKQSDGNLWFYKRNDFNYLTFLTSSSLTGYTLQSDGNKWYVKQSDGNAWYQLKGNYLTYAQNDANLLNYHN
jgi:hypothetical protein